MTWTRQLTQRLKKELSEDACTIIDFLAANPNSRFSVEELVDALSLKNEHALRAFLGKTTEAAKRIGLSQEELHSWFVFWTDNPDWQYWLNDERSEWWTGDSKWSKEELKASVDSYLQMLDLHRSGTKFIKKDFYRELAKKYGRTEKSYEYRAQNISYVLELLGREWLPGLIPARNVGSRVIAELEELLAAAEGTHHTGEASFGAEVREKQKKKNITKPKGNTKPRIRAGSSTSYQRDAAVVAWVLRIAEGRCESCGELAPFVTAAREPFLEVHHVRQLADGGPDIIENAIAVCPNCHRALHHALDRHQRTQNQYRKIKRLVK